jgi:hypothetical protein
MFISQISAVLPIKTKKNKNQFRTLKKHSMKKPIYTPNIIQVYHNKFKHLHGKNRSPNKGRTLARNDESVEISYLRVEIYPTFFCNFVAHSD